MKFGLSQLGVKTPRLVLQIIQISAALGAALVAFFAGVDFPAETEAFILKAYSAVAATIAIIGQFFGVEPTTTYPTTKK